MTERVKIYQKVVDDDLVAIGETARALGVTVATIRAWDRNGLIKATRTPTGHRRFARSEIDRLRAGAATATP